MNVAFLLFFDLDDCVEDVLFCELFSRCSFFLKTVFSEPVTCIVCPSAGIVEVVPLLSRGSLF